MNTDSKREVSFCTQMLQSGSRGLNPSKKDRAYIRFRPCSSIVEILLDRSSCVLAVVAGLLCGCATSPPPNPADYRFTVPQSEADRNYLGLHSEATSFQLEDIQCEVLVIDCFDMYCHLCQAGAGHVNELYRLGQDQGLAHRVKFIGLGVGDTPFEVSTYMEKFKVPFPLFPDRRTLNARKFGELKLPNLIILRKLSGQFDVIHRSPGPLRNPADLLSHIRAGLTQSSSHRWNVPLQAAQPTCGGSGLCTN